jgi:hypothetical protein
MTTVREICETALVLLNYADPEESVDDKVLERVLAAFRRMLDSWSNYRGMIYHIEDRVFPVEGGKATYTLGPGGDWDVERPMAIEQAYVRLNAGSQQEIDIQMGLMTDAQYASIPVKNTPSTFGFQLYDDRNDPLRNITIWPVPNGTQGQIVLWLRDPLDNFDCLDDTIVYPPGYERAMLYGLAVEIAPLFSKTLTQDILQVAESARTELIRLNHVPRYRQGDGGSSWPRRFYNSAGPYITGGFFPGSRI